MTDNQEPKDTAINQEKAALKKRAYGFLMRRGRVGRAFEASKVGADLISDLAGKLKPRGLDLQGLEGRYPDGGVRRFHDMTRDLSDTDIERQLRGWMQQRMVFQYSALFAMLAIPVGLVFLQISKYLAIGLAALFLFSVFRAIRADFFAWIIEQGRFGGFYDYLTTRLPRNMQIMLPEHKRKTRK